MCNITQNVLVACCPDWPVIIKVKAFYLFFLFIAYFKTSPSNFHNRLKNNNKKTRNLSVKHQQRRPMDNSPKIKS